MLVGLGFVGLILSIAFSGIGGGSMTILFSDLDPASASSISAQLQAEDIPHETNATATLIRVPSGQADSLRLRFASEGLSGGVVGNEIFDGESSFGKTSFELNINKIRAIEGELARSIKSIRSIREARVHIVAPERRPFQRNENRSSASILVHTAGILSSRQIQSIVALVSSAVPGLSPDNVTLTDGNGNLLAKGGGKSEITDFSDMEEVRLSKEQLYRDKIETLIGRVVGPGMVRAEVAVTINTDRRTTSETIFDPDGQVTTASTTLEKTNSEGSTGGQVTAANNLPGAAANNGDDNSQSSETTESTNFANSSTNTVTVQEPGDITQIRVSVLVDHARVLDATGGTVGTPTVRPQAEMDQLRALVLTALPEIINRTTGAVQPNDANVTVAQMRFVDPTPIEAAEGPLVLFGLDQDFIYTLLRGGALFVVALLVIFIIIRPIIGRILEAIPDAPAPGDPVLEDRTQDIPAIAAPGAPLSAELMAAAAAGDEDAAAAVLAARDSGTLVPGKMRTDSRIDVAQVEGRIQESAIKKVAEIIRSNPDESVAIVRTWLYAD